MIGGDPRPPGAIEPEATWCRVCGAIIWLKRSLSPDDQRCFRHRGRNPCAIDGCKRSTKADRNWFGVDLWLCQEHWPLIRPHSAERRVYHRIFRLARRYGWNAAITARYWRIWRRLLARARARAAGDIDEAEIRRLFGWDAPAK